MKYRVARFMIDDGERFLGYTKDDHWNGFECPCFELDVAKKVMERYSADVKEYDSKFERPARFDEENDVFIFQVESDDEEYERFEGYDIVVDGETKHVYAIGAWSWVWDEDDGSEEVMDFLRDMANCPRNLTPQNKVRGFDTTVEKTVTLEIWDIAEMYEHEDGTYSVINTDMVEFVLQDLEIL